MPKSREEYFFSLDFRVRDYECDMEGIVNNAVYQNYLEHARHEMLRSHGVRFSHVVSDGLHPVVVRSEIDYRKALQSGDEFWVGIDLERPSRLKLVFVQDIYRVPAATGESASPALNARIIAAILDANGRPIPLERMHPAAAGMLTAAGL